MRHASVATLVGAAACMLLLTSCSFGNEPAPTDTAPGSPGPLGAAGCEPPSPIVGQEVQGTGSDPVTAYGEFQGVNAGDLTAGVPIKLVVRMTGSGDLSVDLTAPDGTSRPLDWGPEPHTGSNYDRPGDEWGTGFSFDAAGCWALNLKRDGGDRATFWLTVQEQP